MLFTWSSFLYCQLAPRRLADLLSVQFGGKHPFLCALVEIIDFLHNRPVDGKVYIDDDMKAKMEAYLEQYGAKQ